VLQRSKSAVGVVIAGIVPALLGGPVFAAAMILFCTVGYLEYERLANGVGGHPGKLFLAAVPLAGAAALADYNDWSIVAICGGIVAIALAAFMRRDVLDGAFTDVAFGAFGVIYLAIPTYAAVMLRQIDGDLKHNWLQRLADWLPVPWDINALGLGWFLIVLTTTWLCDTGQYLFGRAFGKRPLSPRISPKKTVEGFIGGLITAAGSGALGIWVFGIDHSPWLGLLLGAVIAVLAIIGDLAESLMKRQAGVKDSGDFIPGHGGMLDRIDSLLFTFTAGWLIVLLINGPLT
jgi:phosphatidate cytidylyltransferase